MLQSPPRPQRQRSVPTLLQEMQNSAAPQSSAFVGRRLRLEFLSSWGDPFYVGLTGLEVLVHTDLRPAKLSIQNLHAIPRDMNDIPGHRGDPRILDRLVGHAAAVVVCCGSWTVCDQLRGRISFVFKPLFCIMQACGRPQCDC